MLGLILVINCLAGLSAGLVLGDSTASNVNKMQPCVFEYNSTLISQGEVYTPNYPRPYPNNMNCRYEFHARENERVIIQVDDFQLEPPQTTSLQEINFMDFVETVTRSPADKEPTSKRYAAGSDDKDDPGNPDNQIYSNKQCFYDFLDVFTADGQGRIYWRSRHCGNQIDPKIVSTSPTLILVFHTDRMLNFRGFKFRFHFSYLNILPLVTEPICGPSEIVGKGGLLSSPNYPDSFPANTDCAWTITVEKHERILIKFTDINLNQPCHQSHVSIWDGYVSDVNKPDLTVCEKLRYYHKGIQQFNSKTNRLVLKFAGNKNPRQAAQVTTTTPAAAPLPIMHQHEEDGEHLDEDHRATIKPANDSAKKDNLLALMTGKQAANRGALPIKNGFQLSWTAVYIDDSCPEFQCKGGEYCIDTKNFLCQETFKYCISNTLVCDGVYNCDTGDESDEIHCKLTFIQSRLYLFLTLVGGGFFVIICLTCCLIHKINRRRVSSGSRNDSGKQDSDDEMREGFKLPKAMPSPIFIDLDSSSSSDLSNKNKKKANKQQKKLRNGKAVGGAGNGSAVMDTYNSKNYKFMKGSTGQFQGYSSPPLPNGLEYDSANTSSEQVPNTIYYNSNKNGYLEVPTVKSYSFRNGNSTAFNSDSFNEKGSTFKSKMDGGASSGNGAGKLDHSRYESSPTYSNSLVSLSTPIDSNSSANHQPGEGDSGSNLGKLASDSLVGNQNYTVLFPTGSLSRDANQAITDSRGYSNVEQPGHSNQHASRSSGAGLKVTPADGDYDNDNSRTLRRNSYTKAIFFENTE